MKVLIAPDKFKSSLTARQVSEIIQKTLSVKGITTEVCPLADGGEGTAAILTELCGGRMVAVTVHDPLMRLISASYGISPDGSKAYIEMAQASGLWRLKKEEYDPGRTTTWGTGELIIHALESGARQIILGCGGSATNDGGCGMAAALGWKFFDEAGESFIPSANSLHRITDISAEQFSPFVKTASFKVISDVTNPLAGPHGAAFTFGSQKGATPETVIKLDEGLRWLDKIFQKISRRSYDNLPGAGAGGGMGAGARFFLNAEWEQGIDFLIKASGFEQKIRTADLVISGEGKLDHQSIHGKVVSGVAALCRKHYRPLWVVCGINELSTNELEDFGINRVLSTVSVSGSLDESISRPDWWVERAVLAAFQ